MRRSTRITGILSIASLVAGLILATPAASASTVDVTEGIDFSEVSALSPGSSTFDFGISLWIINPPSDPLRWITPPPTPAPVPQKEKAQKPKWTCENVHVMRLYKTGFRGKNLIEAWAIIMRESGGREDGISSTGDYGVFQFNKAAHSDQPWWNTEKLLTWEYNMQIGYEMSQGGRTWYPWDISGRGEHLSRYSPAGVFNKFLGWYDKFPCELPGIAA